MCESKVLPGTAAETPEERERRETLITAACEAEERFSLDELEAFTKELAGKTGDKNTESIEEEPKC